MVVLSAALCIVYVGFYLFIVFITLSIACGMYYIAELMEEYTMSTKRILSHAIKAEVLIHLLLFLDKLPIHCLALGFFSHLIYGSMLKKFPYISMTSMEGLLASAATLVTSAAWLQHYWATYYTVEYIAAFMLTTTWFVPGALFLSMAGEQAVLPGAGGYPYSSHKASSEGGDKSRRGVALRFFDVMKKKRDEVLPDMLAKLPASAGIMKEKI